MELSKRWGEMAAANTKRGGQKIRSVLGEEEVDKVIFYHDWCKHCNICVAFCPKQALAMDENNCPQLVAPERCGSCGLCEVLCPDFAVTVPGRHRASRPRAGIR